MENLRTPLQHAVDLLNKCTSQNPYTVSKEDVNGLHTALKHIDKTLSVPYVPLLAGRALVWFKEKINLFIKQYDKLRIKTA